jgi:hypothetical protein
MNSVRQREGETIIKVRFFPVNECRLLTTIELLMETKLRMKACLQTCSKSLDEVVMIEIFGYFQIIIHSLRNRLCKCIAIWTQIMLLVKKIKCTIFHITISRFLCHTNGVERIQSQLLVFNLLDT